MDRFSCPLTTRIFTVARAAEVRGAVTMEPPPASPFGRLSAPAQLEGHLFHAPAFGFDKVDGGITFFLSKVTRHPGPLARVRRGSE
jgi:hypothetical protein